MVYIIRMVYKDDTKQKEQWEKRKEEREVWEAGCMTMKSRKHEKQEKREMKNERKQGKG